MRRVLLGLFAIVAMAAITVRCRDHDVRIATFNIEMFPDMSTDFERVAATIAEADADVLALQEIKDDAPLQWVLAEASRATGRAYEAVLSPCLSSGRMMTNGIVWDASRWSLAELRHYPGLQPDGEGSCTDGQPGLLAVLDDGDGSRVAVLSVHLPALPQRYAERQRLWPHVLEIQRRVEAELGIPVLALGDFNSTGPLDDRNAERRFIDALVDEAGYELLTADIECTEYWHPTPDAYHPSVLDHVVATSGDWTPARPLGYCPRLECRPVAADDMDPDYYRVSDHCPVVVEGDL
jgi:endonuclease/exonuclease/phosphatase family metal-dependent hydrolase